jgi:hypothetical protein
LGWVQHYALSRVGIEPQKAFLTAMVRKWKPEWMEGTPGMAGFSNVRGEYMRLFLGEARKAYDGGGEAGEGAVEGNWAESYVVGELGFMIEEVGRMRANSKGESESV